MKNILIVVLVLLLLTGGFVYLQKRSSLRPSDSLVNVNSGDESQTPLIPEQYIKTVPDLSILKAGGSSYLSADGFYVFLYPSDYKLDEQNNGKQIRLFKRGATQKGQTEIYDGVLVVFESVNLENMSLSDWVDARIKESTTDGTNTLVKEKTAVLLNTYSGFSYETKGFGEAKYLVIQKDKQSLSALLITYSVNDPQNVDYQSEVNSILSTIELRK